jgi:YidC/Oxa1 family membrane protein insertase
VVFYSEKSGFWKYYKDIVEELLKRSNLRVHYITNDPDDQIFEIAKREPRIIPYYIGVKKLITLMMKLDADMIIMTTPDLENFHLKRSYIRKDIEYIYTPHECMSMHLGFREDAFDHFDTLLIAGPPQMAEMKKREEVFNLPKKNLVPCGYVLIDDLIADQEKRPPKPEGDRKQILIAPSWNEDNLLDCCVNELITSLMAPDRRIIVRPHPEYMKRYKPRMDALMKQWEGKTGEGLMFETDFSSNSTIYESDLLVTDWSAIANDYAYSTLRPVLCINTKVKMQNYNWKKLGITPIDFTQRDLIGKSLNKDQLDQVNDVATEMLDHPEEWSEKILEIREKNLYNIGHCGQAAAEYIISRLTERQTKA